MKPVIRGLMGTVLLAASIAPLAAQDVEPAASTTVREVKISKAEALSLLGAAAAQGPQPPTAESSQPLQVQIVIARYQNEKRVSSLPFLLSMSTSLGVDLQHVVPSKANVRMGSNVAVPTTVFTPQQADNPKPLVSYNYQNVGTNIDVTTVFPAPAGRIGLSVAISETTLKPTEQGSQVAAPGTNTYQSQNTVFVKDGETAQFTAATDRLTGEVVRIEVTAKIVK